jgi:hypothetical protein
MRGVSQAAQVSPSQLISAKSAPSLEEKELDVIPIAPRCRLLLASLATVAATALVAAPMQANAAIASAVAPGCPYTPVTQPFAPWSDMADYFLAPDGALEQGGTAWTLRGNAAVATSDKPFQVGPAIDRSALRLPAGASATTAPFCIGVEHRTMRFVANAPAASTLDVDVLYTDAGRVERTVRVGAVAGAGRWAPTVAVPMIVNALASLQGNAMSVRLRFSPHSTAAWTIDDVYVDPYRVK